LLPLRTVEPSATWQHPDAESAQDASPVLERYFRHLGAGRFPEAVASFSPDVMFVHPPYSAGTPRAVFHGRDELLDGFANTRGPTPARQVVASHLQAGRDCFIEGVVDGIPNGGSFVSTFAGSGGTHSAVRRVLQRVARRAPVIAPRDVDGRAAHPT
jgi:SnoaL-like domain